MDKLPTRYAQTSFSVCCSTTVVISLSSTLGHSEWPALFSWTVRTLAARAYRCKLVERDTSTARLLSGTKQPRTDLDISRVRNRTLVYPWHLLAIEKSPMDPQSQFCIRADDSASCYDSEHPLIRYLHSAEPSRDNCTNCPIF